MKPYRKFTDALKVEAENQNLLSAKVAKVAKVGTDVPDSGTTFAGFATFADSESVKSPSAAAPKMAIATAALEALAAPAEVGASEPPPAGGRWKLLVQLWNIEKARDLVDRLIVAAGPHRVGGLDQILEKLRTSSRTGTRKIEYLERLCEKFAANPYYWPGERPDRAAVARMERDKAIAVIKRSGGRITRKKLLRHVDKHTIQAMLDFDEIVPIGVGEYGLPGAQVFRWTSTKIVEALWVVPDHPMELDELAAALGRDKNAVREAVARLRRNGIVVVRGKTIALSPKTVQQIKDEQVIRHGKLIIMRPRPDQFDLFAAARQTSTLSPPSDEGRR
jgi:hypothetical protein